MKINRVKYLNVGREDSDFEIVSIKQFFETKPKRFIETDSRLSFWSIIYIIEGEGSHSIDFIEYPYKKGDLIVLAKNQVHSFRVNFKSKGYIININDPFFIEDGESIDMDMLAFFQTPYRKPIFSLDIDENVTSRKLIDLIYKEYQITDLVTKKLIKALYASFIYSIRIENSEKIRDFSSLNYEYYYNYRELVEKNFQSLKAVSDYESLMNITKKTINLACRECADISAKTLIINRIVVEAKRLIVQGKLMNYEISDELGFDEPANFAGFFKRYTGMSMKEFRNETRNKHQ